MRVLMVSNLWPPEIVGGAEQYAARLADRLLDAGHDVHVLTLGDGERAGVSTVAPWPYPIRTAPSQPAPRKLLFHAVDLYNPRAKHRLDAVLDEVAPDVVHTHVVQGLSTVALTRPARRGIAHVHTLHDYWLLCQRNSMVQRDGTVCGTRCRSCVAISRLRDEAVRRSPPGVVLAVSQAIAREHEVLPWVAARLRVQYNPVELVTTSRALPRGDGDPLTFGFLGRLGIDKGVRTLLDAFAHRPPSGSRLVVAGRGELEGEVQAAGPPVVAAGWVDAARKESLLDDLDCIVVPSEWKDPAPVVVNEARGRGIPVIGAAIGGIPELVAPECRELLFPPGDVAALGDRLHRFAAAPARYRPVPEAEPVDWPGHLDGVLAAYEDARQIAATKSRTR
jgi:glycosyltransferase involved in cell wall biosynthesis